MFLIGGETAYFNFIEQMPKKWTTELKVKKKPGFFFSE